MITIATSTTDLQLPVEPVALGKPTPVEYELAFASEEALEA